MKREIVRGQVRIQKIRLPAGIGEKVHKWKMAYTRKAKHRRRAGEE